MSDDQRRSRTTQTLPHRITVLGAFTLSVDGAPVALSVDARRLVAYLAVHHRPQARAALAADLWPGVAAERLFADAVDGRRRTRAARRDDARRARAGRRRRGRPGRGDAPDPQPPDDARGHGGRHHGAHRRHPARLERRLDRDRARAVPPAAPVRHRGAQPAADHRGPLRRRRRDGQGRRAHRTEPRERPARADRGLRGARAISPPPSTSTTSTRSCCAPASAARSGTGWTGSSPPRPPGPCCAPAA